MRYNFIPISHEQYQFTQLKNNSTKIDFIIKMCSLYVLSFSPRDSTGGLGVKMVEYVLGGSPTNKESPLASLEPRLRNLKFDDNDKVYFILQLLLYKIISCLIKISYKFYINKIICLKHKCLFAHI